MAAKPAKPTPMPQNHQPMKGMPKVGKMPMDHQPPKGK